MQWSPDTVKTHLEELQGDNEPPLRVSCVLAKNISCWFTEIPKMLHRQGIFSSNYFELGLLSLPCRMVLYWEAFGARTSCLLLEE